MTMVTTTCHTRNTRRERRLLLCLALIQHTCSFIPQRIVSLPSAQCHFMTQRHAPSSSSSSSYRNPSLTVSTPFQIRHRFRQHRLSSSPLFTSSNENDDIITISPSPSFEDEALQRAKDLQKAAARARAEAELMEAQLTIEKIEALERRVSQRRGEDMDPAEYEEIVSKMEALRNKLGVRVEVVEERVIGRGEGDVEVVDLAEGVIMDSGTVVETGLSEKRGENADVTTTTETSIIAADEISKSNVTANEEKDTLSSFFSPSSDETRLPLTPEQRLTAIENFGTLSPPIQSMMAQSVLPSSPTSNYTAEEVIDALIAADRLYTSSETGMEVIEISEVELDDFFDSDYIETAGYVSSLLPDATRKYGFDSARNGEPVRPPTEEEVKVFLEEVVRPSGVWEVSGMPEAIPGGFVVRGSPAALPYRGTSVLGKDVKEGWWWGGTNEEGEEESFSGEEVVAALQKRFMTSSMRDKLQFFYMKDITPYDEEDFTQGRDFEAPILVILGPDVSRTQDFPLAVKGLATLTSLGTIGLLSLFASVDVTTTMSEGNVMDFEALGRVLPGMDGGIVAGKVLPLFFSILGVQAAHEMGHAFVAWRNKFKTSFPTLIPSLSLGLQGTYTPLTTPPPTLRSLFDYALAGPLTGLLTSLLVLILGLQLTLTTLDPMTQLPHLSIEVLQSSTLAGGITDVFLGGVVSLGAQGEMIPLHPLAIAGYVGLIANALSLLPIGSTDGGRIALSIFGRSFSRVIQAGTLLGGLIAGLCRLDDRGLVLTYLLYVFFTQRETEIPCRNEVDEVDFGRVVLAIGAGLVAILALVPIQ